MENSLILLLATIIEQLQQTVAKGNTAFELSFEEVDCLSGGQYLVSGENGGLVMANMEAVPLIYLTGAGYAVTCIESYSYILCPACTTLLMEHDVLDGLNQKHPNGNVEPFEVPAHIRTIDTIKDGLFPKFIILNHRQGIIHKGATRETLSMLHDMNESSLKHLNNPLYNLKAN